MGLEFDITINAPLEFIFDFFDNGKKMVELVPEHFVSWELVEPEENGIRIVKVSDKIMFGPASTKTVKERLTRPQQIRSEVVGGDGEGTVTVIEFSSAEPNVTVLKMSTEIKGTLTRWLGKAASGQRGADPVNRRRGLHPRGGQAGARHLRLRGQHGQ